MNSAPRLNSAGLEPDGAWVVAGRQADIGIERRSETTQQGDGEFGAGLFDALDLALG